MLIPCYSHYHLRVVLRDTLRLVYSSNTDYFAVRLFICWQSVPYRNTLTHNHGRSLPAGYDLLNVFLYGVGYVHLSTVQHNRSFRSTLRYDIYYHIETHLVFNPRLCILARLQFDYYLEASQCVFIWCGQGDSNPSNLSVKSRLLYH